MSTPYQGPRRSTPCSPMLDQAHSQLLEALEAQQQINQLTLEVLKLRKEAEVARLEAMALDKEWQVSKLLGRLEDLDCSAYQLGALAHQQDNNRPYNKHPRHQSNHNQCQPDPDLPQLCPIPMGVAHHHKDHQEAGD